MRYIDFELIDKSDVEVKKWMKKAKRKAKSLSSLTTHDKRKAFLRNNNIWSEFKPILINYFGKKCWYSECDLTGSYGDVDHFRPKNRSTDENDKVLLADGYWWLAYDYLNYRLSCETSNRPSGDGGKRDRFPLKPGSSPAAFPDKSDIPVLLDPCVLQDVQLIDCDENGEVISLSSDDYEKERVSISKKMYNWNCFNVARRKVRLACKIAIENLDIVYSSEPDKLDIPLGLIKDLTDDQAPYSSFARKYIKNKIEEKPYADVLTTLL